MKIAWEDIHFAVDDDNPGRAWIYEPRTWHVEFDDENGYDWYCTTYPEDIAWREYDVPGTSAIRSLFICRDVRL